MSDKQDPIENDPAGWIQVGLAIAAFGIAIMAFADLPTGVVIGLLVSVLSSAAFVLGMLIHYVLVGIRHESIKVQPKKTPRNLFLIYLLVAAISFYVAAAAWMLPKLYDLLVKP